MTEHEIEAAPVPFAETEQGRREARADQGFTGTLRGFLDWIDELLMYGGLIEGEPMPHPIFHGREVVEVAMITGGFSTDERLLGRVFSDSILLRRWWESTHAGGKKVYLIPTSALDSDEVHEWLKPADGVFEIVARARSVQVHGPKGEHVYLPFVFQGGVELVYHESRNPITDEPTGSLTIRPWPVGTELAARAGDGDMTEG